MTISIHLDTDTGEFELWCSDGRMRAMPLGPRLFRTLEPREFIYRHPTMEAAATERGKIETYMAGLGPKKVSKKDEREKII